MRPICIWLAFDELEEKYTWFHELGEEIGFVKWMNGLFAGFHSLVNGDVFLICLLFPLLSLCFMFLGCYKTEKYRLRHVL